MLLLLISSRCVPSFCFQEYSCFSRCVLQLWLISCLIASYAEKKTKTKTNGGDDDDDDDDDDDGDGSTWLLTRRPGLKT